MLNLPLKYREFLNTLGYQLSSEIDKILKEKFGNNYQLNSFKIIEHGERYIKIHVNGNIYRINIKTKDEIQKKHYKEIYNSKKFFLNYIVDLKPDEIRWEFESISQKYWENYLELKKETNNFHKWNNIDIRSMDIDYLLNIKNYIERYQGETLKARCIFTYHNILKEIDKKKKIENI